MPSLEYVGALLFPAYSLRRCFSAGSPPGYSQKGTSAKSLVIMTLNLVTQEKARNLKLLAALKLQLRLGHPTGS